MSSGVVIKPTESIKTGKQGQYESLWGRADVITVSARLVRSVISAMGAGKSLEIRGFGSSDNKCARFDLSVVFPERLAHLQSVDPVFY